MGRTGAEAAKGVGWPFLAICCAPLLALRGLILATRPRLYDFVTYWASGRLFVFGGHPYSASAMLAIEQGLGWQYPQPLIMLCPPWSLPAMAALAWLPFRAAQAGWFAVSLLLNVFSSLGLWSYFGGQVGWGRTTGGAGTRQLGGGWIALLVAATFFPMGGAELMGQVTPLMLASLTAFLLLLKRERQFLAGLFLFGLGFKPQLVYLVALALVFSAVRTRAWKVLAGAFTSFAVATGAALAWNRNALDYFHRAYGAATQTSCGVGGVLRSFPGVQDQVWLQFLPCAFGVLWFLACWLGIGFERRRPWSWDRDLPLLMLVSIGSSPYFWYHDFILILPAVISIAVRGGYRNFFTPVAYVVVQVAIFQSSGLPEAWRSAACLLWIPFYLIAEYELGEMGSRNAGQKSGQSSGLGAGLGPNEPYGVSL